MRSRASAALRSAVAGQQLRLLVSTSPSIPLRGDAGATDGARGLGEQAWVGPWPRQQRNGFVVFVLALTAILLINPRFLVLGHHVARQLLFGTQAARPDLAGWPYFPVIVLPFAACAVATYFASHRARIRTLVLVSLPLSLIFGYADVPSVAVFGAFVAAAFTIIKLPIGRGIAASLVTLLAAGLLVATNRWMSGQAVAGLAAFQVALVPMLWYSVYEEEVPRRKLRFTQFAAYMWLRFFQAPVVTYRYLFGEVTRERLSEVRLTGVKTLYIASIAAVVHAGSAALLHRFPSHEATGFGLLLLSYAGYVGECSAIVATFNLVIGVVRLFGVPVRDNFNFWLLARTPCEHWQRWNILFREWIIASVFFPIMRSCRSLFRAVMAAMLVSGLLHSIPALLRPGSNSFKFAVGMGYYILNGLAVYAVLQLPKRFPNLVTRLRIDDGSLGWSAVGVVLTSTFYSVLFGVRSVTSPEAMLAYFERLVHL